jgi:phage tail sheath protein FI
VPTGYVYSNSDGDDGAPITDYDLIGSSIDRTGMFAISNMDEFNFLCIPPISRDQDIGPSTLMIAARFCRERRALLIVDPPASWATADDALRGLREWNFASEDALMFFPRILAHDKLRGRFEAFAPCGAVAGMLAKGDEAASVWAAAETDEPILRPGFRPVCWIPDDRRARLALQGVNTLQTVRSPVDSSLKLRTLGAASAAEPGWRYLAERRQALAILNSIEHGTRWIAVAWPQDDIAGLLERQVREFFMELHAAGTFGEHDPADAFYVVADRRSERHGNGNGSRDLHEFQFLVGFAAQRRGQFHTFRISQSLLGSQVRAVTLNQLSDPRPVARQITPMAARPAEAAQL